MSIYPTRNLNIDSVVIYNRVKFIASPYRVRPSKVVEYFDLVIVFLDVYYHIDVVLREYK